MADFSIEECQKWLHAPFINPRTGEKLTDLGKKSIFAQLQKRCAALKLIASPSVSSPVSSSVTPPKPKEEVKEEPKVVVAKVLPKVLPKLLKPVPVPVPVPSVARTNVNVDLNKERVPKKEKELASLVSEKKGQSQNALEIKQKEENNRVRESDPAIKSAIDYIKLIESETYIEEFHPQLNLDEDQDDEEPLNKMYDKTISDTSTSLELTTRRFGACDSLIGGACGDQSILKDGDDGTDKPKKPRVFKKNKKARYYMYTGWSVSSGGMRDSDGVIPIIDSNWASLVNTMSKEIHVLESVPKHRISIVELPADHTDFRDYVKMSEIREKQFSENYEYDYLDKKYMIPCFNEYFKNWSYDIQESRMLIEFLASLSDVMVDLTHILIDCKKPLVAMPKAKTRGRPPKNATKMPQEECKNMHFASEISHSIADRNMHFASEISHSIADKNLGLDEIMSCKDLSKLTVGQLIFRTNTLLKPLIFQRMEWEEKYSEYFTDDDWFYIDFLKMVQDLTAKEFKELCQRTFKKRVPDKWLTEQYRDTDEIEEFLAHLERTIDELYGSDIAREGSDEFEQRLNRIIEEFARIKSSS
jgi:hypothetical protein